MNQVPTFWAALDQLTHTCRTTHSAQSETNQRLRSAAKPFDGLGGVRSVVDVDVLNEPSVMAHRDGERRCRPQ